MLGPGCAGHSATEMLPTQCPFMSASVRSCPEKQRAPRGDNLAGLFGFSCGAMSWMGSGVVSRFRVVSVFETVRLRFGGRALGRRSLMPAKEPAHCGKLLRQWHTLGIEESSPCEPRIGEHGPRHRLIVDGFRGPLERVLDDDASARLCAGRRTISGNSCGPALAPESREGVASRWRPC